MFIWILFCRDADFRAVGFYKSKGLMREYPSAAAFAEDTKVPLAKLQETFESLQTYAAGTVKDPFGKSTCSSILDET